MKPHSTFRRWTALGTTIAVFAAILTIVAMRNGSPDSTDQALAEQAKADMPRVWAMFGGTPGRNMVNTVEKNLPTEWEIVWKSETVNGKQEKVVDLQKSKNIKWATRLGSRAYGGPVIANGKVIVGTNNQSPRDPKYTKEEKGEDGKVRHMPIDKGIVMCFRESDGAFVWQAVHDKLASGIVNDWNLEGVCATPIIEGNRVYYTNNRCEVICLELEPPAGKKEPTVVWKLDMIKDLNVFPHNMTACSPVIVGDLVFVVTANGVDEEHLAIPSPTAPSFIAVNKKTGKVVWKDNSPGKQIMHGQWSNPTYAMANGKPQIIFPGGDGWLRAFEPETGKLIWKFDGNPKGTKYELGGKGTKSDYVATPVVVGNRCYIGLGQDPEHVEGVGHLWCIDITKQGDVSPELVTDEKSDPPKTKPNPNRADVWHYGGPVKKEDQEKIQRDYYFSRTMCSCAVHDGLVYVADLPGFFYCFDAATGKLHYSYDLKATPWGSPYWVDGKIYIATEDGDVSIFEHGKELKKPLRVEMGSAVRATPVAANGVLYVMTESHLFAIAKK
jgi:outer membrane protein assembly factor BamB